jgi:hypothetical protein
MLGLAQRSPALLCAARLIVEWYALSKCKVGEAIACEPRCYACWSDAGGGGQNSCSLRRAWVLTKFCGNLIDTYPSFSQRNTTSAIRVLHQEPHSPVCVEWFGSVAPTPKPPHPSAGVTGATI